MPSIMRQINVIARTANIYRMDKAREKGLDINPAHFPYMRLLYHHPGLSQDAIAKRLCINKSNVTRHLAQLERLGYVERRQSEEDKRVINVFPTEKLTAIQPDVIEILRGWSEYLDEVLTEDERELILPLLVKLSKHAAEYAEREFDGGSE